MWQSHCTQEGTAAVAACVRPMWDQGSEELYHGWQGGAPELRSCWMLIVTGGRRIHFSSRIWCLVGCSCTMAGATPLHMRGQLDSAGCFKEEREHVFGKEMQWEGCGRNWRGKEEIKEVSVPKPSCGILLRSNWLVRKAPSPHKTIYAIVLLPSCRPELVGKTLLPRTFITIHREINFKLNWKLLPTDWLS